jgi:hypothetical protein
MYCNQNETVKNCPVFEENKEVIVAINNPSSHNYSGLARILLPHENFDA